jgi:hypothetical protein
MGRKEGEQILGSGLLVILSSMRRNMVASKRHRNMWTWAYLQNEGRMQLSHCMVDYTLQGNWRHSIRLCVVEGATWPYSSRCKSSFTDRSTRAPVLNRRSR